MNHWLRAALAAQLLTWTAVHADSVRLEAADPVDPKVPVPAAKYDSALEGYRPYEETGLRAWRESNEAAGALGGHRGQVRGQAPATENPARRAAQAPKAAGSTR